MSRLANRSASQPRGLSIKLVQVILILAVIFAFSSCKESERHKAKRLGLEYKQESSELVPRKAVSFSFADTLFEDDSSVVSVIPGAAPLIIADALPSGPLAMEESWTVVDVYDGDTITISNSYGELKVRLLGYDTPEMRDADPFNKEMATEARDYLRSLIIGQTVRLRLDRQNIQREHLDRYGRTLAYVYREYDKLYVNAQMMRMGYSREYEKFAFEDLRYFRTLAAQAKEENRGLWAY